MVSSKINEQGLPEGYPFQSGWEVTPRRVKAMLDGGEDFLLLDCRLPKEYALAKVDSAVFVPMQELPGRINELDAYADRPIVVFCHGGVRSMRTTAFLREQGFDNVMSMAGGIDLWSIDVDSAVPRY